MNIQEGGLLIAFFWLFDAGCSHMWPLTLSSDNSNKYHLYIGSTIFSSKYNIYLGSMVKSKLFLFLIWGLGCKGHLWPLESCWVCVVSRNLYVQTISTKWVDFEGKTNFTMNYNNFLNKWQTQNLINTRHISLICMLTKVQPNLAF